MNVFIVGTDQGLLAIHCFQLASPDTDLSYWNLVPLGMISSDHFLLITDILVKLTCDSPHVRAKAWKELQGKAEAGLH